MSFGVRDFGRIPAIATSRRPVSNANSAQSTVHIVFERAMAVYRVSDSPSCGAHEPGKRSGRGILRAGNSEFYPNTEHTYHSYHFKGLRAKSISDFNMTTVYYFSLLRTETSARSKTVRRQTSIMCIEKDMTESFTFQTTLNLGRLLLRLDF